MGYVNGKLSATAVTVLGGKKLPLRHYTSGSYSPGQGVIALRFDDGQVSDYNTVFPALVSRDLVGGFAITLNQVDNTPTYMTLAQIKEIEAAGNEIMCHSRTHDTGPESFAEFYDETVQAAKEMRGLGLKISSFVQPGTWSGDYVMSPEFIGSAGDKLMRKNFWSYGGKDAVAFDAGGNRYNMPRTKEQRYGWMYKGFSESSLATCQACIDNCIAEGRGSVMLIHSYRIGTGGSYISEADFLGFLDYVEAKRDAGQITVVLPTELFFAAPTIDISLTCPAIVPELGAEIVSNGEFTANVDGYTAQNDAVLTHRDSSAVPGTPSGGADNGCLEVASTGTNAPTALKAISIERGAWYRFDVLAYSPSSNVVDLAARMAYSANLGGADQKPTAEDVWEKIITTRRATNTSSNNSLRVSGSDSGDKAYFDQLSLKKLNFASLTSSLGTRPLNGVYACRPIVSLETQAGLIIGYADASNYVMAYADRTTGTKRARLVSCIEGTITEVIAESITYVAEAELKVIVCDGDFTLFYNNAKVGTTQTIATATLGTGVYGFATYETNQVGAVTAG
jgi:hypothetical protein